MRKFCDKGVSGGIIALSRSRCYRIEGGMEGPGAHGEVMGGS